MKISAIVSVYNTQKEMIHPSLESILSQRADCEYEVIIVDDGSGKETHDILLHYVEKYPFCRLVTHEVNKGLSAARNTGMSNASGDYIFFPDSDDVLFPGAIEKIANAFGKEPDASFVSFGWVEKKKDGQKTWLVTDKAKSIGQNEIVEALCMDSLFKGYVWNKVFNLKVIGKENIPQFDTKRKVFEDKIWILSCASFLHSAYLIPDVLYSYEFNYYSITRSASSLRARQFLYYEANREIVSLSRKYSGKAYFNALEYYFSLTWNDYFYWMFVSHFDHTTMKENAVEVLSVLKDLPFSKIQSRRNRWGYCLFNLAYQYLGLGK